MPILLLLLRAWFRAWFSGYTDRGLRSRRPRPAPGRGHDELQAVEQPTPVSPRDPRAVSRRQKRGLYPQFPQRICCPYTTRGQFALCSSRFLVKGSVTAGKIFVTHASSVGARTAGILTARLLPLAQGRVSAPTTYFFCKPFCGLRSRPRSFFTPGSLLFPGYRRVSCWQYRTCFI